MFRKLQTVHSIGVISNGYYDVLPTDIQSHSYQADSSIIRTVNFRVLFIPESQPQNQIKVFRTIQDLFVLIKESQHIIADIWKYKMLLNQDFINARL
jgi:hypothetical protein